MNQTRDECSRTLLHQVGEVGGHLPHERDGGVLGQPAHELRAFDHGPADGLGSADHSAHAGVDNARAEVEGVVDQNPLHQRRRACRSPRGRLGCIAARSRIVDTGRHGFGLALQGVGRRTDEGVRLRRDGAAGLLQGVG